VGRSGRLEAPDGLDRPFPLAVVGLEDVVEALDRPMAGVLRPPAPFFGASIAGP
jgi:hypothetical protein